MSASDRPKPPNSGKPPDPLDPDVPPSDEERRAAEALRAVLAGKRPAPRESGSGAETVRETAASAIDAKARAAGELARSLRAAASPRDISSERQRQLLDRALSMPGSGPLYTPHELAHAASPVEPREAARDNVVPMRAPKNNVAYLAFGAAGLLVAAAAVVLVIRSVAPERPITANASAERAAPALALSRSTAELFPEGIARSGGTTDRVDRIAYARAQDFRQNQFARWGTP